MSRLYRRHYKAGCLQPASKQPLNRADIRVKAMWLPISGCKAPPHKGSLIALIVVCFVPYNDVIVNY